MKIKVIFRTGLLVVACIQLNACMTMSRSSDKLSGSGFSQPEQKVLRVPAMENGAIYQQGMQVGLFADTTARAVGDIVTIELTENFTAAASSDTSSSKDNKVNIENPTLAGEPVSKDGKEVLKNELQGEREFSGQGSSNMNSNLQGKITATVMKIFPNGNLLVAGEKMMRLNQSDEYIRFTGVVRPADISPENIIPSFRVANVHVAYSGQGSISDANRIGTLGKYFQSTAWPY